MSVGYARRKVCLVISLNGLTGLLGEMLDQLPGTKCLIVKSGKEAGTAIRVNTT